MSVIATLATNHALDDLKVFLSSLELWSEATVYIYADTLVAKFLKSFSYKGKIIVRSALDVYSGKTRLQMEKIPGKIPGKSLWFEFQMEKLELLRWVFASEAAAATSGVFYLDSDICFFGPLPSVPSSYEVAVSPHMIRRRDEALYGKYNAGYMWVRTEEAVDAWRQACVTSRFFEQAALEIFDSEEWSARTYQIPVQNNYGWWRMFQAEFPFGDLQKKWSIFRRSEHSGILVDGVPLASVHTHWKTGDVTTATFNRFVKIFLTKLASSHPPAKKLLNIIHGP
jgi:hypothetical protein